MLSIPWAWLSKIELMTIPFENLNNCSKIIFTAIINKINYIHISNKNHPVRSRCEPASLTRGPCWSHQSLYPDITLSKDGGSKAEPVIQSAITWQASLGQS